ncbi:hypothetical protein CVO74_20135 [Xanthomonas prunicola]|uniref:Uncharacterized protein n=1 Tax=Xanthomonas prunicola TaxID=2053930 RepID=A0A2N3RDL3_9XANT|nr:hypothetical protein XpruCFBP8353_22655 [Xanthomonas prunicola]PKV15018.1 hypothetical protein XpruCFBP8354_21910 [Xanthomonas prunicola]PKV19788.1 hypothetical protein CVO74_20135 [Xanthomonas prunicola]
MAGGWADVMRWSAPARQVEPPSIANLGSRRRAGDSYSAMVMGDAYRRGDCCSSAPPMVPLA